MNAGRWNQSALKPHLASNSKNIKDYYPRHQKGHEHVPKGVHAKFRGQFLRETQLNTSVSTKKIKMKKNNNNNL